MTEYDYERQRFCPSGANTDLDETVQIPDDAIGVTTSTWGDPESVHDDDAWVGVQYLIPVEENDD